MHHVSAAVGFGGGAGSSPQLASRLLILKFPKLSSVNVS